MKKIEFYTLRDVKGRTNAILVNGWTDGHFYYYYLGDRRCRTWYAIGADTGRSVAQASTRKEAAQDANQREENVKTMRNTPRYSKFAAMFSRAVESARATATN